MYNNGENGISSPILTDVTFSGNEAERGGAMYNDGEDYGTSSPTLTNVTFSDNKAKSGGAMKNSGYFYGDSSTKLNNVAFYGNSAESAGGGMYNSAMSGDSSPELTNVTFSGNSADYGGGAIFNDGTDSRNIPILINVIFSGNSAKGNGGAIYNVTHIAGYSNPKLTNVTFSGNKAQRGGAMYNEASLHGGTCKPNVRNSVLWNNQDSSGISTITATIFLTNNATISLTHSLIQNSFPGGNWIGGSYMNGGGNIDEDPLFILDVDPSTAPTTTGNLCLKTGSPAIDAGDNNFMTGVLTDLDGNNRIMGGIVDMGAYETLPYCFLPLIFR